MLNKIMPKLIFCIVVVLITACATQAPEQPSSDTSGISIEDMRYWEASGKLSVTVEDDRKSASFSWKNSGDDYSIRLFGPIGIGAASLEKNAEGVTLSSNQGVFRADDGQSLLKQHMDLDLPIKEIHWWIKGLADPDLKIQGGWREDENGNFLELTQSGWEINFDRYTEVDGLQKENHLPQKVNAFFDPTKTPLSGTTPEVAIKVIIKNWRLDE